MFPATLIAEQCNDCHTPFLNLKHSVKFWLDSKIWICEDCEIPKRTQRQRAAEEEDRKAQETAYKSPTPPRLGRPFGVWQ